MWRIHSTPSSDEAEFMCCIALLCCSSSRVEYKERRRVVAVAGSRRASVDLMPHVQGNSEQLGKGGGVGDEILGGALSYGQENTAL